MDRAEREKVKDLGYVNGWDPEHLPEKYVACHALGHVWAGYVPQAKPWQQAVIIWRSISAHVGEYECPVCKIRYRVDSSD